MADVSCAACRTTVPESDTYFGTLGTVCSVCHANEEAYDDWSFRGPEFEGQRPPEAVSHHEQALLQRRPEPPPRAAKVGSSPTRCGNCGDPFGDAGAYHSPTGSGLVCLSCHFS